MSEPTSFLCVRTGSAAKAGRHSTGSLTYAILRDAAATEAYFIVTGNTSGGYYSREAVPFSRIEQCLAALPTESAIPAKALRAAFRGNSANDGGFLLALLRHEGLLAPSAEAPSLNIRQGDWAAWRQAVLDAPGEPFEIPTRPGPQPMTTPASSAAAEAAITNAPGLPGKAKRARKDRESPHAHPTANEDNDHETSA